jgi:hypothetical protein
MVYRFHEKLVRKFRMCSKSFPNKHLLMAGLPCSTEQGAPFGTFINKLSTDEFLAGLRRRRLKKKAVCQKMTLGTGFLGAASTTFTAPAEQVPAVEGPPDVCRIDDACLDPIVDR